MESNVMGLANIDLRRKKKISVKLEDSTGTEIDIYEIIKQVNSYIADQLSSDEETVCLSQIHPLISQVFNSSLQLVTGNIGLTSVLMSQHLFRNAIIGEMMITFYFLKFIQKHNIKIVTTEENISEEEIEKLLKSDKIAALSIAAINMGMPLAEIATMLIESGQVSKEELINSGVLAEEDFIKTSSKKTTDN